MNQGRPSRWRRSKNKRRGRKGRAVQSRVIEIAEKQAVEAVGRRVKFVDWLEAKEFLHEAGRSRPPGPDAT